MTTVHFVTVALALGVALAHPLSDQADRYEDQNEPQNPAETANEEWDRQKRAFPSWSEFSKWKPPLYQLTRPYYIPVYGAAGKRPIFFPPQRLNINPGVPQDNPLPNRPFMGPGYLPPTTEEATTMNIVNRFIDEDDEDRPVWSGTNKVVPDKTLSRPTRLPPASASRPTRPSPASNEAFPPLVHDIKGGRNQLAAESEVKESAPLERTTTSSPASSGPSSCVWAIVSCCSANSDNVPDECFKQRGCPGPFWGPGPCDSKYAKDAIAAALNYYRE